MSQGQNKVPAVTISDAHNVPEVFVTSVVNAALIGGSSIAVTLGMRRMTQETFTSEPQEVVHVVSRPILTVSAAEELVGVLSELLARARSQGRKDIAPGTATPQ